MEKRPIIVHVHKSEKDPAKDFINYVKDARPIWYREKQWIPKQLLLERYNRFAGAKENIFFITNNFKNKLYRYSKSHGVGKKKKRYICCLEFKHIPRM